VIPHGLAIDEQPAELADPASRQVIGRYRATGMVRWLPAAFAAFWLLLGTAQYLRASLWGDLAIAAMWTAVAVTVWVLPRTMVSDGGVRFLGQRTIPWSQVVDVVARPDNRWGHPPELVLRDGRRKPLWELDDSQVEGLRRLAREQGAPVAR
jgi:hypothetical protein